MSIQYPMWLPHEEWKAYKDMRKQIKKPLTPYGEKLALRMLERLKDAGHKPNEVLEQSIFQSWQGLFPIKQIQGLTLSVENKKDQPGRCRICGCAKKRLAEGYECKGCGNRTSEWEG